jgi:hypothetical protein
MSIRSAVIVGVLWLGSLAAVVGAREQAAVPQDTKILSGGDIGFRVDSIQGNVPAGTLVIRWNGKWVEPTTTKKPVLITR